MIWRLPMHQSGPFVLKSCSLLILIRAVRASSVVIVAWVHSSTMRRCGLSMGLTLRLRSKLLLVALLIRGIKGLSLRMRLSMRISWIKWNSLSILVARAWYFASTTHKVRVICRVRYNGCDRICVFKATSHIWSIWSCSIICSRCCKRLSSYNTAHNSSFSLIIHVLIAILSLRSSTFWRAKGSTCLTISNINRYVSLTDSAAIDHLSLLCVQHLLRKSSWNMSCRSCSTCSNNTIISISLGTLIIYTWWTLMMGMQVRPRKA